MSWVLWWDYHQTFTDPLNLFHSNLFYPLRYTLAFSVHSCRIALLFFPLFALVRVLDGTRWRCFSVSPPAATGVSPGAHAHRLHRPAWIAGIVFAFVPFRFLLMYRCLPIFPWIPLVLEALVLFARRPSQRRAVWRAWRSSCRG